jgi:general stress protein 26
MKRISISEVSEKMNGIDIAILSTHSESGEIANRPMSNNGDVKYNGDSYFFTYEEALCVSDIERDPKVALSYSGKTGIFTGTGVYIAVEGRAELIRDKAAFQQHWTPDLDSWFDQGVETPNLVLIKVKAKRIKFWDHGDEGEAVL